MRAVHLILTVLLVGCRAFMGSGLSHMIVMQGGGQFFLVRVLGISAFVCFWESRVRSAPIARYLSQRRPPTEAT